MRFIFISLLRLVEYYVRTSDRTRSLFKIFLLGIISKYVLYAINFFITFGYNNIYYYYIYRNSFISSFRITCCVNFFFFCHLPTFHLLEKLQWTPPSIISIIILHHASFHVILSRSRVIFVIVPWVRGTIIILLGGYHALNLRFYNCNTAGVTSCNGLIRVIVILSFNTTS